jgi:hypothetical protein
VSPWNDPKWGESAPQKDPWEPHALTRLHTTPLYKNTKQPPQYWQSHCAPAPSAELGPAATIAAAWAEASASSSLAGSGSSGTLLLLRASKEGMTPLLFERLILRLCDWPAWRARALRDALDARAAGLLPARALVVAVALLAAAAGATSGGGGGGEVVVVDGCGGGSGRTYEQLRTSLWRVLAHGREEDEEDQEGSGRGGGSGGGGEGKAARRKQPNVKPYSTVSLASAWDCARMVGAEERHLADAWQQRRRRRSRQRSVAHAVIAAAEADALVRDALCAQACDPVTVALSVPCYAFEWPPVAAEVGVVAMGPGADQHQEQQAVAAASSSSSSHVGGNGAKALDRVGAAALRCCRCTIS